MRILQVVTLVSPDGEYGGPLRVALNQAKALRDLGHVVTLAGATRGYQRPPDHLDGVPTKLFTVRRAVPRTGFAGLTSPGLLRWIADAGDEYDVIHIHLARDLVTLPSAIIALRRRLPVVLQTHGMIDASGRRLAHGLDALATRRVLRHAHAIFYLTERERRALVGVGAPLRTLRELRNGVPVYDTVSHHTTKEVLFLGRLHQRKNAIQFVRAALELSHRHDDWIFTLVGPDEGDGQAVASLIGASKRVRWVGSLPMEKIAARMGAASIYALPSVDEPYPMSVLEAMASGLPVVITDSNGLAPVVSERGCGVVTDGSDRALVEALETLISDAGAREQMGMNGRRTSLESFSMRSVAQELTNAYLDSVVESPRVPRWTKSDCEAPRHEGPGRPRTLMIVQPYVPAYRAAFFERLTEVLWSDGIATTIVTPPVSAAGERRRDAVQLTNQISRSGSGWSIKTPFGSAESYGAASLMRSYDAVIVPAAASLLDALYAVWGPGSPSRRVGLWGHIGSFVKDPVKVDLWLERRMLRRADHVFAYTEAGAAYARMVGVSDDQVTNVVNTIDTAELEAARRGLDKAALADFKAAHTNASARVFGYIGALDEGKGLNFLVDVLDELHRAASAVHVLVAGEGPYADRLARAAGRGQATLLGYADARLKALVAGTSEALLNPGRVGLNAVDALTLGIPIVSTPSARHAPEVAYLQEGTNLFTGPDDPLQFAAWLASTRFSSPVADAPTLDDMVARFRAGVLAMWRSDR